MSQLPVAPYILCSNPATGYFDIEDKVKTKTMATQLGLLGNSDSHTLVYDSEGVVWSYSLDRPIKNYGFWSKALAQIYNPAREVNITWTRLREYSFDELRIAFLSAVDLDDDILTQFTDHEELTKRIVNCHSFTELISIYNWACFGEGVDEFESDSVEE